MFNIGSIIEDCEIIDVYKTTNINTTKLKVRCLKCGRERIVGLRNIQRGASLSVKHGKLCSEAIQEYSQHFYEAWVNMKNRTKGKYKKRNIKCEEFEVFADFYDKMYKEYKKHVEIHGEQNTTLERVDNDLDYSSSNCIWTTKHKQAGNKSNTIIINCIGSNGEEFQIKNLKAFCEENELNYGVIYSGVHKALLCNRKYKHRETGWVFYGV